ncbi:hypothetical protein [Brevundimonas pishanensis]|uniref:hypothetical protein n=1 Tax=Brevundimonas pishanensis TaxID=2896315 RepID=UPI001FA811D7|nr:hypothetical protein [Brevundimonas pishanensis]
MESNRIAPLIAISTAVFSILAAGSATADTQGASSQDQFFANLATLCGQRFEGKVINPGPTDGDFAGKRLLMHVRDCEANEIRIPFWVGDDHSRTWFITRTENGMRLKHDHRDPDGTTHTLHWYGGETTQDGSPKRQEFPVDQESIDLFTANNSSASNTNIWAVEVHPTQTYVYELRRPTGRHFRVEFDLTKPVVE